MTPEQQAEDELLQYTVNTAAAHYQLFRNTVRPKTLEGTVIPGALLPLQNSSIPNTHPI